MFDKEQDDDNNNNIPTLLIVGLGRIGKCVAKQAAPYFDTILATTSTPSTTTLTSTTIDNLQLISLMDIAGSSSSSTSILENYNCTHVLITIPGTASLIRIMPDKSGSNTASNVATVEANLPENGLSKLPANEFYNNLLEKYLQPREIDRWIGVLSTTAVYGNHNGQWVNEESECLMMGDNAASNDSNALDWINYENDWIQRIGTIRRWLECRPLLLLRIFRCAGIYGVTRSALHTLYYGRGRHDDDLGQSTASPNSEQTLSLSSKSSSPLSLNDAEYTRNPTTTPTTMTGRTAMATNRIHEDDLCRAVVASMLQWKPSSTTCLSKDVQNVEIYNLADDLPESRQVVMEYAAGLLATLDGGGFVCRDAGNTIEPQQAQSTTLIESKQSVRARRRVRDQKRVDNSKMKQNLLNGTSLLFPSYKEGLQSILHHPLAPWNNPQQSRSD
ncbi:hypothetical protein ACA910_000636 [Epithemia clementina (nom. ined.)]